MLGRIGPRPCRVECGAIFDLSAKYMILLAMATDKSSGAPWTKPGLQRGAAGSKRSQSALDGSVPILHARIVAGCPRRSRLDRKHHLRRLRVVIRGQYRKDRSDYDAVGRHPDEYRRVGCDPALGDAG